MKNIDPHKILDNANAFLIAANPEYCEFRMAGGSICCVAFFCP